MPLQIEYYSLPKHSKGMRQLGQLVGAAYAIECAEIIDRYTGLVVLITANMQSALRLHDEILQFSTQPISIFADWEILPYDSFSPHQDIISSRLSCLYQLPTMDCGVIILPINTLMQRVCPYEFLRSHILLIKKGQYISRDKLCTQLKQTGYHNVNQVTKHGEFAICGTLLDLYPMGNKEPCRIDFFNDKINSLRLFNVNLQNTLSEIKQINLLPAHEFPTDKAAIELFRYQWREKFEVRHDAEHIYQQVSKGILPIGIEYWQPLFFNQPLPTLFSYLPENTLLININDLVTPATIFWQDINQRYQSRRIDPMRPLLAPNELWLNINTIFSQLKQWPRIQLKSETLITKNTNTNLSYQPLPILIMQAQHKAPMNNLDCFSKQFNGSIVFLVESEGRKENLQILLAQIKINPVVISHLSQAIKPGHYLMTGTAECGFLNTKKQLALICENDLLGKRINRRHQDNRYTINTDMLIRNLVELNPGQPVVHLEHGVGRYLGLITLETRGIQAEYLILIYAGEDKLYVPVSSLSLISYYCSSTDENIPLHRLGGDTWNRERKKVAEKIRDIAVELLDIYSQRAAKPGFKFKKNNKQYSLFCQGFPFELTVDQEQAIHAVLNDMCQPLVMDRLVCGDVGFGKTEIAMRAAFLAFINNKQVAVLVPTTLLAQQHFNNFRDRFATWPVQIEMLSRFRSLKEQQIILQKISEGKIDIIIGTHKLLQADLHWKDLGLLIIDEEHRFGVHHKERIKSMRTNIDILTLTATPIPRTLNMAMNGIRDLSIITTPPARRLAVKTFVQEYDAFILREAILREILRGGQVFYLYNKVEKIEQEAKKLAKLVPEATIAIGHGQMHERDLERVMNDFYHHRFDILVCTTIIETGIDVPCANTIIIDRADRFGLAQLHQLRGRVGRSHHQAYAYLLVPQVKQITNNAQKRLEAIALLEDLGAGFALATHDLEIRGAGELLGDNQSGQITTIGFSLYMEILENTISALKAGREPSIEDLLRHQIEIEMHMPTLLPDTFISDVKIRLSFYKRIANAVNNIELNNLKAELIDRFGSLPDVALYLLQIASLRQQAQKLGIKRIEGNEYGGFIEFGINNHIDPNYLIRLLKHQPQTYQLEGPAKIKFIQDLSDRAQRLKFIKELLLIFEQHTIIV
ncbi:transcription-repair coupling factor [Candidatus Fukatsuia anoeciicola]|uniref:transcription-repair coupling factor n=1 Tax=Candidatus Fukatsuia anoeciicola TaxID=2994492 RepID=UPI0034642916